MAWRHQTTSRYLNQLLLDYRRIYVSLGVDGCVGARVEVESRPGALDSAEARRFGG